MSIGEFLAEGEDESVVSPFACVLFPSPDLSRDVMLRPFLVLIS